MLKVLLWQVPSLDGEEKDGCNGDASREMIGSVSWVEVKLNTSSRDHHLLPPAPEFKSKTGAWIYHMTELMHVFGLSFRKSLYCFGRFPDL